MTNGNTKSNGWDGPAAVEESGVLNEAAAANADIIAELRLENERLQDIALRDAAEVANTRWRSDRDAKDASQFAIASFAREILQVSDNLQRAMVESDHAPTSRTRDDGLGEGVRATARMLASVLSKFGVAKIDAAGKQFDPNCHEAVMVAADSNVPLGTVVRVVEDGYTIHDRLLRPARVVIAAAQGGPHPDANSDGEH